MRIKLKKLLRDNDLTLKQFGREIGMDYSSLQRLCAGKSKLIGFRTLQLITMRLGVTRFDELFEVEP